MKDFNMLTHEDAAIVKGLLARGEKQHDVASVFGVNPGRIAEIATGAKFRDVKPAPASELPSVQSTLGDNRRFVDPKSPIDQQVEQLDALIRRPPQNSRVVTFTPELAEWIVSNLNDNNRRKRPGKIRRFAEAMQKGWGLTGDTIKFGKSGVLLDGQNRLSACVRAGVPLTTHVVFGIDDKLFAVLDQGATRTNPDTFQIAGIPYPVISAQATRWLMIYEADSQNRGATFGNDELLRYYQTSVDLDAFAQAIQWALQVPKKIIPHGTLVAHLYMFAKKATKPTAVFAKDLAEQARGARKLIMKIENLRKQNIGRIHENQLNALIIQAWRAYRAGEGLTSSMLNWTETKEYPTID